MAAALWGVIVVAPFACTLDPDDRCGPNQVLYSDESRCVCVEGTALVGVECVKCGDNEVAGPSGCGCAPGYSRPAEGAACELPPAAQGSACDAETPCSDAVFDHCEIGSDGSGYCTNTGCAEGDCAGGYGCDLTASPSVCRRPPEGLGRACTSSDDCAGTEATFCETFKTKTCQVQGCSFSPDNCFTGFECCDLSSFGNPQPLCLPAGDCPT